jgi:hypothetical protein
VTEVLGILRTQKGTLMMIEPPGEIEVGRVLEIDDGVDIAIEEPVFEKLVSAVSEARVGKLSLGIELTSEETSHIRGGSRSIKAMVMI